MKETKDRIRTEPIKDDDISIISVLAADAFAEYELQTAAAPYLKDKKKYRDFLIKLHEVFFISEKHNIIRKVYLDDQLTGMYILHRPEASQTGILSYIRAGGMSLAKYMSLKNLIRFRKFWDSTDEALPPDKEGTWHLLYLAVSPAFRKMGIAGTLIDRHITGYVSRHGGSFLTLTTNNEENLDYYIRHGFRSIDRRPLFFNDQKIMNWTLIREMESNPCSSMINNSYIGT